MKSSKFYLFVVCVAVGYLCWMWFQWWPKRRDVLPWYGPPTSSRQRGTTYANVQNASEYCKNTYGQKFCMVQFCGVVFDMLYSTYGKKSKQRGVWTKSVCPDFSVSVLRLFFTACVLETFKRWQHRIGQCWTFLFKYIWWFLYFGDICGKEENCQVYLPLNIIMERNSDIVHASLFPPL